MKMKSPGRVLGAHDWLATVRLTEENLTASMKDVTIVRAFVHAQRLRRTRYYREA